jgi:hypothetical protein
MGDGRTAWQLLRVLHSLCACVHGRGGLGHHKQSV